MGIGTKYMHVEGSLHAERDNAKRKRIKCENAELIKPQPVCENVVENLLKNTFTAMNDFIDFFLIKKR